MHIVDPSSLPAPVMRALDEFRGADLGRMEIAQLLHDEAECRARAAIALLDVGLTEHEHIAAELFELAAGYCRAVERA